MSIPVEANYRKVREFAKHRTGEPYRERYVNGDWEVVDG